MSRPACPCSVTMRVIHRVTVTLFGTVLVTLSLTVRVTVAGQCSGPPAHDRASQPHHRTPLR